MIPFSNESISCPYNLDNVPFESDSTTPAVDTTAPIISNFTTTQSNFSVIISGNINETSNVVISRDGTPLTTLTNQTFSFTFTDSTVGTGTFTYTAVATDSANNDSTTASSTITTFVYTVEVYIQAEPLIQVNGEYKVQASEADLKLTSNGSQLPVDITTFNGSGTGDLDDDVITGAGTRINWTNNYTLYPNATDKDDARLFTMVSNNPLASAPDTLEITWVRPDFTPSIRVFVNGVDKGSFTDGQGATNQPNPNLAIYNIS